MKDTKQVLDEHGNRRRDFITKTAKAAYAAPVLALLWAQSSRASAQPCVSGGDSTAALACDYTVTPT